jgi:transcriptional regulator with XRE-family HTH domain
MKRIRELRDELRLTQVKFGERLGLAGNTIAQYEYGHRNPPNHVILAICKEFNVREEWIRNGEGEMFNAPKSISLDEIAQNVGMSDLDKAILAAVMTIDASVRQEIFDTVKNEVLKNAVSGITGVNYKPQTIAAHYTGGPWTVENDAAIEAIKADAAEHNKKRKK